MQMEVRSIRALLRTLEKPGPNQKSKSGTWRGTQIDDARAKLAEDCAKVRIHHLDPGTVRIDGVRGIGATLWTDFALNGPTHTAAAHLLAARQISDFTGPIHHQGKSFTTGESARRDRSDRAFIKRELEHARRAVEPVIVVTHHAPSPRCVPPWFQGDPFNLAFASNLDSMIARIHPRLRVHGHLHGPVNERLGETRILANPAGYRRAPCSDRRGRRTARDRRQNRRTGHGGERPSQLAAHCREVNR